MGEALLLNYDPTEPELFRVIIRPAISQEAKVITFHEKEAQ